MSGATLNLIAISASMTCLWTSSIQMVPKRFDGFRKWILLGLGVAIVIHLGAQVCMMWEGTRNLTWVLVSLCLFHAGVMFWLRKPLPIIFGIFSLLAAVLVR